LTSGQVAAIAARHSGRVGALAADPQLFFAPFHSP
jgi:hypothetical protein